MYWKILPAWIVLVMSCTNQMLEASFLSASTTKLRGFVSLDLAAGLEKYIQHENKRLEVIKNAKGYEKEVPLVVVRLEKLGRFSQMLAARQADEAKLKQSLGDPHPTTTLRLVRDFLDTWADKLSNETLYGFRLREFLTNDKSQLPSESDLDDVAQALVEIQYVYNLSTSDLYAGKVMGFHGSPLKPRDAYDLGRVSMKMGHFKEAATWFETAVSGISKTERTTGSSSFPVAEALANLGVIKFNMDEKGTGVQLLEEAADLDPESGSIVKLYLSHRFGRDVQPLVETDPGDEKRHWFQLCANATSGSAGMSPLKWYHVCRYRRSSAAPYRVYREEILSRSPFLALVHHFVNDWEANQLVNVSVANLTKAAMKGAERWLHFVEGASLQTGTEITDRIADRISDLTGLYTRHTTGRLVGSWIGEPLHVLNYGLAGTFLPHTDDFKTFVMRHPGYRMASVLIYLSDVEAGGATTFTTLNITLTPRKGNALLWYNLSPSGETETAITHAGCPAAVGAKWVATKGIWTYSNELARPCGVKRTSSHLAVDKMLATKHKTLQLQHQKRP